LALTPKGAEALLADKGYDSNALVQAVQEKELAVVKQQKSSAFLRLGCIQRAPFDRNK